MNAGDGQDVDLLPSAVLNRSTFCEVLALQTSSRLQNNRLITQIESILL